VTDLQTIPLLEPADYQTGSKDLDSINMGLLHKVRIIVQLGAITGNDAVFKLYAGATAGTKTTEIAWSYRKSTVDYNAASADVFGDVTAVAAGATGLTLTDATAWDHRTFTIDFVAASMPETKPWLTVESDDGSASVLLMSAVAVAWPRYEQKTPPTAL
jgi:hypothetical protein